MSHLALTRTPARPATGRSRRGAFLFVLAFLLFPAVLAALGAAPADAATSPPPSPGASAAPSEATVSLDPATTKPDGIVKVSGGGWTPGSMVNIAICGQNAMSGTRSCAVPTSITLPVGPEGTVSASLKAVVPPVPCPCVVRVVTVTGGKSMDRNTPLEIQGAPFAPLPDASKTPGRLTFVKSELVGKDNLFNWFGSPVQRRFVIEVGNMGQTPITNPVFKIGTYEGVYAPTWEDKTWQGVIAPGARVKISLPIELAPRQHGAFKYRVMYDGRVVDEVALNVGRPWGVYLFGALMVVVVPMTVWRLGVSLVRAIRDHGKERAVERDREVGLPGTSAIRNGKDAGKGSGADPADPDDPDAAVPAPEAAREPALVPGGGTPRRRVEETMVVGAPLFAGPEPARGREPAAETEAERTKVLPSEPPATRGRSGGTGAVSPSDVANGLAWNAGEERDEP
ncbi:hypothetical protein ACPA54_09560 [Uniformispora flossi]|uniref:hypothetical protein n=1 Tax=Uniformispora flossi TaxID=3390723 RepID=UPI003C2CD02B